MNKKAQTKIQRVGIGSLLGFSGIIIMSFGSMLSSIWMLRGGIALTTFGIWLVSWN